MFYFFSNFRTLILVVFFLSFIILGLFFFTFFLILTVPFFIAFYFYRKYFIKKNLRDEVTKEKFLNENYKYKNDFIDAEFKKNDDNRETWLFLFPFNWTSYAA